MSTRHERGGSKLGYRIFAEDGYSFGLQIPASPAAARHRMTHVIGRKRAPIGGGASSVSDLIWTASASGAGPPEVNTAAAPMAEGGRGGESGLMQGEGRG